eukprot:1227109-Alexandrium_andersonii.AAC.1
MCIRDRFQGLIHPWDHWYQHGILSNIYKTAQHTRSIHHPPERLAAELRAEHPQASDRTLAHMRQKA